MCLFWNDNENAKDRISTNWQIYNMFDFFSARPPHRNHSTIELSICGVCDMSWLMFALFWLSLLPFFNLWQNDVHRIVTHLQNSWQYFFFSINTNSAWMNDTIEFSLVICSFSLIFNVLLKWTNLSKSNEISADLSDKLSFVWKINTGISFIEEILWIEAK